MHGVDDGRRQKTNENVKRVRFEKSSRFYLRICERARPHPSKLAQSFTARDGHDERKRNVQAQTSDIALEHRYCSL